MQADVWSMIRRPWQERLSTILDLMREMSRHTDPQEMVRAYIAHINTLIPLDRRISLSRRGLTFPEFRVTRYSEWTENINPWKDVSRLPVHKGGLFAELL
jgi:sigma-B regulation protein RsbU (phosphoserine phosphatase)